jgi:hypothetical protein
MACTACHCPEVSSSEEADQEDASGLHQAQAHVQQDNNSRFTSVNSEAMRDIGAILNGTGSTDKVRKAKRKRDAGRRTLRALSKFFRTLFGHKERTKDNARSDADIAAAKGDLRLNLLSPKREGPEVYDSDAREINTVSNTLTALSGNLLGVNGRRNRRPDIKSYQWPEGERFAFAGWRALANVPDEYHCLPID